MGIPLQMPEMAGNAAVPDDGRVAISGSWSGRVALSVFDKLDGLKALITVPARSSRSCHLMLGTFGSPNEVPVLGKPPSHRLHTRNGSLTVSKG